MKRKSNYLDWKKVYNDHLYRLYNLYLENMNIDGDENLFEKFCKVIYVSSSGYISKYI